MAASIELYANAYRNYPLINRGFNNIKNINDKSDFANFIVNYCSQGPTAVLYVQRTCLLVKAYENQFRQTVLDCYIFLTFYEICHYHCILQ